MGDIRDDLRPRNSDMFRKIEDRGDTTRIMWDLKILLIFYFIEPIKRPMVEKIYDTYVRRFGDRIARYRSTSPGAFIKKYDAAADAQFRSELLPNIYRSIHWGYAFDDGTKEESFRFMFHGYKPKTQPGFSSFCRFEFPYDFDTETVRAFALEAAQFLPFTSGTCGYVLQVDSREPDANDHMYAVCQRFWGVEAWSQDVTVQYLGNRFKCINWLTFLGQSIAREFPDAIDAARSASHAYEATVPGHMFQTRQEPALIDRNRMEGYKPETALATALLPAQVARHDSFLGPRWTVDNTMDWLQRFTKHPDR